MSLSRISRSLMPTSHYTVRAFRKIPENPKNTVFRAIQFRSPDPILGSFGCRTSVAKYARVLLVVLTYACAPSPRSAAEPPRATLVGPKAALATEPKEAVQKLAPVYDLVADRKEIE